MYRKLISLAALAVVVAAISGIGYAAIPASNGVISACKDSKGSLKVIDAEAGQACGPNQQPLSWNQQGPPGISGYQVVHGPETVAGADWQVFVAMCPAGKKVLGGSVYTSTGYQRALVVTSEYPTLDNNGWVGAIAETVEQPNTWTGRAVAICANVS